MSYILSEEELSVFEETAESCGLDLRVAYSGRGMMGENCLGVVGDLQAYTEFLVELINCADDSGFSNDAIFELHRVQQDSMGFSSIFYWPNLQASE